MILKKTFAVWLQIREETGVETKPEPEDPGAWPLARFETEEEARIFATELSRRYSARASGEADVAAPMASRDQFTPG